MHREIISERELIHYKGLGLYHSMEAGTGPVLCVRIGYRHVDSLALIMS